MKFLRWIACGPLAMIASLLVWMAVKKISPSAFFGGNLIENILGLLPLILAAILPNIAFALAGVFTAPTSGKAVAFVFFGLTFCLSAGGFDIIASSQAGASAFWVTSTISWFFGAGVGLLLSLRVQRKRRTAN